VHPNEHVNRSQSTNDVYPTAVRIALIWGAERLIESLGELSTVFVEKADEFSDVLKIGRTQLQDAVPMTLGQELRVYAVMLDEDIQRLEEASLLLHEINFGGTAIGTGITASRSYADTAQRNLARITELPLVPALDLIEATQDTGALVSFSATLKRIAVKLSKTCNDLRLLSSGPRAGFGELLLPPVQAGSSLMPGKVNPVIPEVVSQVAFEVVGHDVTVTMAAEAGQLQLNAFGPVMYRCISESLEHLTAACQVLSRRCVSGLQANREVLQARVNASIATVTALAGVVGYEAATKIATEALASGRRVADLVVECGLLGPEEADRILRPESMVSV
jgi:aspartate ammonia-lyase